MRTVHPMRALLAMALSAVLAAGLGLAACGSGGQPAPAGSAAAKPVIDPGDGGRYAPTLTPADAVAAIDNPYLPLRPGSVWVYEGVVDGERERVTVVVTSERRQVMGISAVVVRDTVSAPDGSPIEITDD